MKLDGNIFQLAAINRQMIILLIGIQQQKSSLEESLYLLNFIEYWQSKALYPHFSDRIKNVPQDRFGVKNKFLFFEIILSGLKIKFKEYKFHVANLRDYLHILLLAFRHQELLFL